MSVWLRIWERDKRMLDARMKHVREKYASEILRLQEEAEKEVAEQLEYALQRRRMLSGRVGCLLVRNLLNPSSEPLSLDITPTACNE